jgi:hypothetical protein
LTEKKKYDLFSYKDVVCMLSNFPIKNCLTRKVCFHSRKKVQNQFFGKLEFSVLTYKHGSEVVYDFDDLRHTEIQVQMWMKKNDVFVQNKGGVVLLLKSINPTKLDKTEKYLRVRLW